MKKNETERLIGQISQAQEPARRIIKESKVALSLAYCFVLNDRLVIGTNHRGCDAVVINEEIIMATIDKLSYIPAIAQLKFIQLDIHTSAERRIKHDLIPIDRTIAA